MEAKEKEYEPDDPMELRGEIMPGDNRAMLVCFVEEYLACGFSQEQVLAIFEMPFYRAAHNLLKMFGRDAVWQTIKEKGAQSIAFRVREAPDADIPEGREHGQGL